MNEREFWIEVRAALLTINSAIERRYGLGKYAPENPTSFTGQKPEKETDNTPAKK